MKSLFVLTHLVIAIAASCTDKTTEATCGADCVWTNQTGSCSGGGGSCGGTPTCDGAIDSVCAANAGCSWIPVSGESCIGAVTCSGQTTQGGCSAATGCTWGSPSVDTCGGSPTTCAGTNADNCALDGCTWSQTAVPASCEGDPVKCFDATSEAGCTFREDCEWDPPIEPGCHIAQPSWTCETFTTSDEELEGFGSIYCVDTPGCIYSGNLGTCTTSDNPTTISCETTTSSTVCKYIGCTFDKNEEVGPQCTGTPSITSCSDIAFGGSYCDGVAGCITTGAVSGTCSGNINFNAGASAGDQETCEELGITFWWTDEENGRCFAAGEDIAKTCDDFTEDGNEICSGVGCNYNPAVEVGCSGTPSGDCATLTISGEEVCSNYGCTWTPSGGAEVCKGTTTASCAGQTGASACGSISGCTFTPAVTVATCSGTNTGQCVGVTQPSCTNVNGCAFSGCATLATAQACPPATGCSWSQPGSCADPKPDKSYTITIPALLGLLLFVLLI